MGIQSLLPRNLNLKEKNWAVGPQGSESRPPFMAKEMQAQRREGLPCDACGRPWRLEDGEITQGE